MDITLCYCCILLVGCVNIFVDARRSNEANKPQYRTAYACEGSKLDISCEPGHLIQLIRANYGRFSISICNEHGTLDWSVNCMSRRSFRVMHRSCAQKNSCSLPAVTSMFGDPCQGTLKYLEAHYQCLPESTTTTSTLRPSPPNIIVPAGPNTTTRKVPSTPFIIRPTTTSTTTPATTSSSNTPSAPKNTPLPWPIIVDTSPPAGTEPPPPVKSSHMDGNDIVWDVPDSSLHYCPPVFYRNLYWNWTRAGEMAILRCPGGAQGDARWQCSLGHPPHWVAPRPDLSECSSPWFSSLQERVEEGDSVVSVAAELAIVTEAKPLYGGDVAQTVDLLRRLGAHMDARLAELPPAADGTQRRQVVRELLQWVVEIGNNLLNESRDDSWNDLPPSHQRQVAAELLRGVEDNALLLADTHNSDHRFSYAKESVAVSVSVMEMHKVADVRFPPADLPHSRVEDAAFLPAEALLENSRNGLSKVVFVSYHPMLGRMLEPRHFLGSTIINSRILSISLGRHRVHRLSQPVLITLKHLQEVNVTNPICVFWNYVIKDWSEEGCQVYSANSSHTVCSCSHLTNFAVLMDVHAVKLHPKHEKVLKILTYTGCIISIVCLFLTILTFQFFRVLQGDRTTIHKHLCSCLLLAELVFVCGVEQTGHRLLCGIIAGALHYLFLAAFAWMFLEGFQLYVMLIEVFETEKSRLRYYYVLAYTVPAVIVAAAAAYDPTSYGTPQHCWLRADNYFILSFVGPVTAIVLLNSVFLSIAIYMMCKHSAMMSTIKNKEQTKLDTIKAWIRGAVVLVFLLGLTWIFGLFYLGQDSLVMAYLFTVFNSLQGLFIFFFHCIKNDKVQKEYQKLIRRKRWLPICLHKSKEAQRRPSLFANSNGSGPPTSGDLSSPQNSWTFRRDRKSSTNSSFLKSSTQSQNTDHESNSERMRSSLRFSGKPSLCSHIDTSSQDHGGIIGDLSVLDCSEVDNEMVSEYCAEKMGASSDAEASLGTEKGPQHYGHLSEKTVPCKHHHRPYADHIYETIDDESQSLSSGHHIYPPFNHHCLYPQLEGHSRSHSNTSRQSSTSSSCCDHHPLIPPPCLPERNAIASLAHVINSAPQRHGSLPNRHMANILQQHLDSSINSMPDMLPPAVHQAKLHLQHEVHQSADNLPASLDPNSQTVMAVLDGERVVCRLHPSDVLAENNRTQCHKLSQLSTDC